MNQVVFENTFDGLLTSVFEIYAQKLVDVDLIPEGNDCELFFRKKVRVATDLEKSRRVQDQIIKYLGKNGLKSLWKATLTETPTIGQTIFEVIRYMLQRKTNVLADFGNPSVLTLHEALKKLSRERHRMTAFVRFQRASDGTYCAIISPDFDVLPIIADHFKSRYADQKWMIFDTKRKYGIYYDLKEVYPVELNQPSADLTPSGSCITLDESEEGFQNLWKSYFKATNIASRRNIKLHLQHVPKRYWKYLTEKAKD
ncbi:TIGR03915 family putative DNA repair protein [Arthrospiribacter ruber]|uniref:DNA metabolism protein n=1 Tax=Arthrospiribacter ruber TaxID=2487934 RepID=A0A951J1A4_9BACT|nr:TIGR03915 family putative DNA repair protein [Arthrospiribacter ruber]MBW3468978.1 DNA metabolism protein [Arthrospiribacter ruber]